MKKKVIVLLSGGIDSTTALFDSINKYDVIGAVSFDYGSKHNERELKCASFQCEINNLKHTVIKLDFINELFSSDLLKSGGDIPEGHYQEQSMLKTVVPFRNGIMLSIAAGLAESLGAEGLVIAAHSGDHAIYPDCRENFMNSMSEAVSFGTYANIEILRPFIDMDKTKIVSLGHSIGVGFKHTYSCYKGDEVHCGKCGTCVERREAFIKAQIEDPTEYQSTEPIPKKPQS